MISDFVIQCSSNIVRSYTSMLVTFKSSVLNYMCVNSALTHVFISLNQMII